MVAALRPAGAPQGCVTGFGTEHAPLLERVEAIDRAKQAGALMVGLATDRASGT